MALASTELSAAARAVGAGAVLVRSRRHAAVKPQSAAWLHRPPLSSVCASGGGTEPPAAADDDDDDDDDDDEEEEKVPAGRVTWLLPAGLGAQSC